MTDPIDNAKTSHVPVEELSYSEALTEVEAIVSRLETSAVDVDQLADNVTRGLALLGRCRQRLDTVAAEVDQVVSTQKVDEQ